MGFILFCELIHYISFWLPLFDPWFTGPEPETPTGWEHRGFPKLISGMEIGHPHCVPLAWQADMMTQPICSVIHPVVFFQREASLLLEAKSDRWHWDYKIFFSSLPEKD